MTAFFPSLSLFFLVPIFSWLHLLLCLGPWVCLLCLWLCAHLLLGLGFPMLPGCPSPSIRLWVYWFQWLLFSTRVPYLHNGVTLLRVYGCRWYPTLVSAGWGLCLGRWLSFAACSRWHLLSGWSSLPLRVLGGSWCFPLCSPDRGSASRSTCSTLPPVSRLSFGLGVFSFGWGLGLCLPFILVHWGCRRTYCALPEAASLREFFPSLLGPFPFGGLLPLSRLFLCWRPCRSCSLIPSLAPSWWWPCPLQRWALLTLSGYVLCMPSAVSLRRSRWSIPSLCRPSCTVSLRTVSVIGARFAFAEGRLPMS